MKEKKMHICLVTSILGKSLIRGNTLKLLLRDLFFSKPIKRFRKSYPAPFDLGRETSLGFRTRKIEARYQKTSLRKCLFGASQ